MPTQRRLATVTVLEVLGLAVVISLLLSLSYFLGTASADTGSGSGSAVPDIESDPGGYVEQAFAAVRSGNWTLVTAMALIGMVYIARKPWALGKIKFFSTDRGGVVMAFGLSIVGGLGHAIVALGKFPLDLATYKAIATTAVTAMGGYVALKRVIWPSDKKKAPDPATT